jgi:hypothetical protein
MRLVMVPHTADGNGPNPLDELWPVAGALLAKGVEYSNGMTTLPEEYAALKAGQKQLWVLGTDEREIIAAATTSLQRFPSGLVLANVLLLGGADNSVRELLKMLPELESWAMAEGCNRIRFFGRKGWARHMGDYALANYVYTKEIDPGAPHDALLLNQQ